MLERSRLERGGAVELERDDRVVDRHGGDRQVVLLRVGDPDQDLAGLELDPPDVELVRLRRVRPDQPDERRARRDERADRDGEQDDGHERPQPPREVAPLS